MSSHRVPYLRLEPRPSNAAAARRFVRKQLAGYERPVVDDAALLVSELATNAILHADGSFVVGVVADDAEVLVLVVDERSDRAPVLRPMSPAEDVTEASRGIPLVRAIASDFGWQPLPEQSGKVVWFTLDGEGASTSGQRSAARFVEIPE